MRSVEDCFVYNLVWKGACSPYKMVENDIILILKKSEQWVFASSLRNARTPVPIHDRLSKVFF